MNKNISNIKCGLAQEIASSFINNNIKEPILTTKKKYWYFTEVWSCVLCGKEIRYKERRFTPKPENPSERTIWHDDACQNHFM